MRYHQLTEGERYKIAALRRAGHNQSQIARLLGRHRSTISREVRRNAAHYDGGYRASKAQRENERQALEVSTESTFRAARVAPSRASTAEAVEPRTGRGTPPEDRPALDQPRDHLPLRLGRPVARRLALPGAPPGSQEAQKAIRRLRQPGKTGGKRHISERPRRIEGRHELGHWEIDTVMGEGARHCILTLVERATGYLLIGKLRTRGSHETAKKTIELIRRHRRRIKTITSDNGTEFHAYKQVEEATGVKFYFATPHHAWERGTNENTNGLIRQYLPKRKSMASITQRDCDHIAKKLNTRPRKRYGYRTPEELFYAA